MRVSSFFSAKYLRNAYVLHENCGAILLDPMEMDVSLFTLLERQNLAVESVLLTHADDRYASTLRSLRRIYGSIDFYGGTDSCEGIALRNVKEAEHFEASGFRIQPIHVVGSFSDSLMYSMSGLLFSGDLVGAGTVEKADESFGRALLIESVEETFKALPASTIVLPSQGPPTTIASELAGNYDILHRERALAEVAARRFAADT